MVEIIADQNRNVAFRLSELFLATNVLDRLHNYNKKIYDRFICVNPNVCEKILRLLGSQDIRMDDADKIELLDAVMRRGNASAKRQALSLAGEIISGGNGGIDEDHFRVGGKIKRIKRQLGAPTA